MLCLFIAQAAQAGPPFFTDDPWIVKKGHHELFLFADAVDTNGGSERNIGIDYAYGPSENLEVAMLIPMSYENPDDGLSENGISNVVLAGKYLFFRQNENDVAIAFGPSVTLPSASSNIGDDRASFTLPIWLGKEGNTWTTFGGGGCTINRGEYRKNYCFGGLVLTRSVSSSLEAGFEIFHQAADTDDAEASTSIGAGLTYGLSENSSLLLYGGTGIQNRLETNQGTVYVSLLMAF